MRSIVGLDREAAKRAFDAFLTGKTFTANHPVRQSRDGQFDASWMSAGQLYGSPFTDFSPKGVEGVFSPEQVIQLVGVLDGIRMSATAAA